MSRYIDNSIDAVPLSRIPREEPSKHEAQGEAA